MHSIQRIFIEAVAVWNIEKGCKVWAGLGFLGNPSNFCY